MTKIYLHGLGQAASSWRNTILQLGGSEQIVCPNLADMIREKDAGYQTLYAAFSDLCEAIDEPIDLCGLSLGGIMALNYAIDCPQKINSLVLIAAQYKMPKGLLKFQNALFHLMPKSKFQQTGLGKAGFIQLCRSMMDLDFSGSLQKVSCPVLVVCGDKDQANKKASVELADMLEKAELQVVGNAGHEINLHAPEQLADLLRAFYHRVS